MLWTKRRDRSPKTGDLTAFIDEGSEIEGSCRFGGTVMLNGAVRGEVTSTDAVIVGESGIVHANIRAGAIVISGQVTGDLVSTQRLELRRPARVFGDIEAPVVTIEEGVLFQGRCQMLPANAKPASHAAEPGARAVVPLKR
jgi:cytoskeletal protein CcmA (bactofilin family)